MKKRTRTQITQIRKRTIAMILVMAIFAGILPDSFTACAAEAIEETMRTQPGLSMQFAVNSAWGGSMAAEIILKNQGGKDIRDWKLTFDWEPVINSLWGAQYDTAEQAGGDGTAVGGACRYTIYPYEYNSIISPGGEVRIGLIASGADETLVEPGIYEVEADGENWVYDTKEDRLYAPWKEPEEGATAEPTEEPGITATPGETGIPTQEPEVTGTPEPTSTPEGTAAPTQEPETTETPEPTEVPEVTEKPTSTPEGTAASTQEPETTETPEPTATPKVTEEPTAEPEVTATPTQEPEPTATPEPGKDPDYNLQDWEFTDDLTVTTDLTLTKNLSCGNLYIKSGTLKTNGYRLIVRKDAEQTGGTLSVTDESTVVIKGDTACRGGILSVGSGKMQIEGELTVASSGELQMMQGGAHAEVGGDCRLESQQYFKDGTLELKGNLSIANRSWLRYAGNVSIKLSGSTVQKVTTEEGAYLHNLDITESAGVKFAQTIRAKTLKGLGKIVSDKAVFAVENVTLEKDETVNCDVEITSGTWYPKEYKLTIAGDLELTGGNLYVEYGEAEVQGDFHAIKGRLQLMKKEARATVDGDCRLESQQYFMDGVLEVKGDLDITNRSWLYYAGNVSVRLCGSTIQKVTTEEGAYLHNLDITESAGVKFAQTIRAKTLKGIGKITSDRAVFAVEDIILEQDETVDCDVEIKSGTWYPKEHKLTIAGDLELTGGNLYVDYGEAEVQGDFRAIKGRLQLMKGGARAVVRGDCHLESQQYFVDGILELKGNLSIPNRSWLYYAGNVSIKLSGIRTQKVTVAEGTNLYSLDISGSRGVKFNGTVNANSLYGVEKLAGNHTKLNAGTATPSTNGAITGRLTVLGGSVNAGGYSLAVEKKLVIKGGSVSADTSGSILSIRKNCEMQGGSLVVGSGMIHVEGDCDVGGKACIAMNSDMGRLYIDGDLTSSSTSASQMMAGDIYAGGNITQTDDATENSLNMQGTLHLTGNRTQTVNLAHPAGSVIAYADLAGEEKVYFKSAVHIHDLEGWEKIGNDSLVLCGYTGVLKRDTNLSGYLVLVNSAVHLNGFSFTVRGLEQYDTIMDVRRGHLHVRGNYGIYGKSYLYMNWSSEARVCVNGDFESLSEMSHQFNCLEQGSIYLWGNLVQGGTSYSFAIGEDFRIYFMQPYTSLGGSEQTVSQTDPDASLIKKHNWDNPNGAKVRFDTLNEMDISPANLYHSFCVGVADAIEETPEKMGNYVAWATIFNAVGAVGKYCGVTVNAGAVEGTVEAGVAVGGEITVAIIVCFLAGYLWINYNEIQGSLNRVFYDLGKLTAECVVIAVIGWLEAAAAGAVLSSAVFQKLVRQAATFIKGVWNGTALRVEVEEILFCFGGTTSITEILRQYVSDETAAFIAKMNAINALPDNLLRTAYNFIREYCSKAEVSLRELRVILKNAGKMADEKLKSLVDWVRKKPSYYDRIEAEGTELLREEEAELADKGLLDKVDDILKEKSEGLADDATLDLDDVEAVIEEAENELNSIEELIARGKKIINFDNPADPFRDVFGRGMDSDPLEWSNLIKQLEDNGVEIIYRKGAMGYAPLKDGEPGQILIDPDASMSALRHEYSHFLEAKKNGYPSAAKCYQNWQARIEDELKAYTVEIEEAERLGLDNVVAQLKKNFEAEKQYIIKMYGPTE